MIFEELFFIKLIEKLLMDKPMSSVKETLGTSNADLSEFTTQPEYKKNKKREAAEWTKKVKDKERHWILVEAHYCNGDWHSLPNKDRMYPGTYRIIHGNNEHEMLKNLTHNINYDYGLEDKDDKSDKALYEKRLNMVFNINAEDLDKHISEYLHPVLGKTIVEDRYFEVLIKLEKALIDKKRKVKEDTEREKMYEYKLIRTNNSTGIEEGCRITGKNIVHAAFSAGQISNGMELVSIVCTKECTDEYWKRVDEAKTEVPFKAKKKPVDVLYMIWTGKNLIHIQSFIEGKSVDCTNPHWDDYEATVAKDGLTIKTLEGPMKADIGDYIIKGVKGEFYPCKPDIFKLTYECK